MNVHTKPLQSGVVGPRRRPPPTPQDIARQLRHADPANGVVRVEAAAGDDDICFIVVRLTLGRGEIVIGCHPSLAEAEVSALAYARRERCLFAPSWLQEAGQASDGRRRP